MRSSKKHMEKLFLSGPIGEKKCVHETSSGKETAVNYFRNLKAI